MQCVVLKNCQTQKRYLYYASSVYLPPASTAILFWMYLCVLYHTRAIIKYYPARVSKLPLLYRILGNFFCSHRANFSTWRQLEHKILPYTHFLFVSLLLSLSRFITRHSKTQFLLLCRRSFRMEEGMTKYYSLINNFHSHHLDIFPSSSLSSYRSSVLRQNTQKFLMFR